MGNMFINFLGTQTSPDYGYQIESDSSDESFGERVVRVVPTVPKESILGECLKKKNDHVYRIY